MTNEELKALCDRAIDIGKIGAIVPNNDYLMQLGELHDSAPLIAVETLRLLSQCEAMQKVVEAAKAFQEITHWGMSPPECELSDALNKALSHLGEGV